MNILSSDLHLAAEHRYRRVESSREHLEINGRVRGSSEPAPGLLIAADHANISALAQARAFEFLNAPPPPTPVASIDDQSAADAIESSEDAVRNDPRMRMLIDLIEALTGRKVRLFDSSELAQAPAPSAPDAGAAPSAGDNSAPSSPPDGFSLDYQRHDVIEETEATAFVAQGVVRTADGQEIRFELQLAMARAYREETSVHVQIGTLPPQRKDPLVVNFSGTAAELVDQRFRFDIDADGNSDSLALLGSGSGFLVLDRNGDSRVNDGRELFGAQSGDGYADLAALDSDGNGWLDAGDAQFAQLRLWTPTADGGGRLQRLADRGVAAISTANIATPFALRGEQNADLGVIRATGVYLSSANSVGTTQQIDLTA